MNYNTPVNALKLDGQRFGRLVVVGLCHSKQKWRRLWECRCDCGNLTSVPTDHLRSGNTKSCGCARVEIAIKMGKANARPIAERFERFVVRQPGCWGWKGNRNSDGYAFIRCGKTNRGGHRVSWEIARGPVPSGLLVLHHCDNPICTNPDHLYIGTHSDNMRDRWARTGRSK